MLLRVWLAFSAVFAVVLSVLAGISILQHNATYSDLLGRRVAVIAQTTAAAFQPIVDLGLPMAMVRNSGEILARAHQLDPNVGAAHAFNPSGIIISSTESPRPQNVPEAVLGAMRLSDSQNWSIETADAVYGGFNVRRAGQVVGSVVVSYPKDRLSDASRAITGVTLQSASAIWAIMSALALAALYFILAGPLRALARIGTGATGPVGKLAAFLGPAIMHLERDLEHATEQFNKAEAALETTVIIEPADAAPEAEVTATREIAVDPTRSLATRLATRLVPIAAVYIVVSAVLLGGSTLGRVKHSFEPEFSARAEMIGEVVSANVQRAVSAGVPIDHLTGAERYFGDLLARLPEVARIAIVTPDGQTVLEAGPRSGSGSDEQTGARRHPIFLDDNEIGAVVIDIDPRFVAKRFRDVFLDMSVVVLVSVLLSFEVLALFSSQSLTAPLDRLQRLAAMQAVGDFSMRAAGDAKGAVGRLTTLLSNRAEALHKQFRASRQATSADGRTVFDDVGRRFGLSLAAPIKLRLSYFTNIRLALFLFAAADELPASFLVLYTRAAANPWPWIENSVLLSLPLAGYLLTTFLASPFARKLTQRFGSRPLLLSAMLPVIGADVALFFSDSVPEIVICRTMTGFGYALVVLACEDFVIDTVAREDRDRALGIFSAVYFGGIFAGTALGGVLADRFGQASVFLVSAGLVAVSLVLIASLTSSSAGRRGIGAAHSAISWRGTLSSRRFVALLVGIVGPAQIMDQAYVVFLVPLILDSIGFSVADIARCLMLYCLAVAAVGKLPGRLVAWGLTPAWGAIIGQTAAAGALLLAATGPGPAGMVAALTLAGFGFGLVRWAAVSTAMDIAETELSHIGPTSVLGTLRPFERIVSVAGLIAIAALAGRIGYGGATATLAICSLIGVALFMSAALARGRNAPLVKEELGKE